MRIGIARQASVWLLALGLVVTLLSIPRLGQAAPAGESVSASSSKNGLRPLFDYPKDFGKQLPKIKAQPRLQQNKITVRVKAKAWRQQHRHTASKWDRLNASLRIAKPGHRIAVVAARPAKVAFQKTYPERTIRRAGKYTLSMRIPGRVKRQLSGLSRSQLLRRVQVVVRNRKDVTVAPGRDTKLLVQSNIEPQESRYGLGSAGDSVSAQKSNPTGELYLYNATPFDLNVSFGPVSCMANIPTVPTDGSNGPGESFNYMGTIMTPYEAETESGQVANAPTIGQDVISSAASAATSAAGAFTKAAVTGNEAGMISAGETAAKGFLGGLISDIKQNACSNPSNEQLWTGSWAVTDMASESDYEELGYLSANWEAYAQTGENPTQTPSDPIGQNVTSPYEETLSGYLGAQASATFNWNNGYVNTGGTSGGAYFSGGLTAISQAPGPDGGEMYNVLTFDDTVGNYYGPSFTGAYSSAVVNNTEGTQVTCSVPTGNMNLPWTSEAINLDSLASAYSVSDFLQSDSDTPGSDGWGPINDLDNYFVHEEFSELEPNKVDIPSYDSNTQYGCLLGAYASQSSMTVNGSSMNLGWYSFPHPWAVAPSATPSPTS